MKTRQGRGTWLLSAWAIVVGAVAPAPAARADASDECRDRAAAAVQKRYEGVEDLSARFEQTTRPATAGATASPLTTSRGLVVLAKPGKMRWTYEEPEPSLVISDGETLWLFDPTFGEAQKLPAAEQFGGAAAEFLLGAGDMKRDFEVRAVSCSEWSVELELLPREPASYEKLYLVANPATGDVQRTRVVDLVGNAVTLELRELRFNQDPPDDVFRFDPPEGVDVIEVER
jgi:outer membrane lipoprotein carrier protein